MSKPKITAKQEGGDDGYCYVVRINGHEFVNGLTYCEVPHYKEQALRHYNENFNKYGGTGPYTPPAPKPPMSDAEHKALVAARKRSWNKLHRQVYAALNNALANSYDQTWEDTDKVVVDIKDHDAGLAGIPAAELRIHVDRWQMRRKPKIKFTNAYWDKLNIAINKKKLSWKKLTEFEEMLSRHDYTLQGKSWGYQTHFITPCCDLALSSFCVCTASTVCPIHGDMHVGSHD